MKSVLVLSPHTDDETLGCGGLIHRLKAQGALVTIALFSHGGAGVKWDGNKFGAYSNDDRLGEFFSAIGTLGISSRTDVAFFCEGRDVIHHRMDTVPMGDLVSFIERCILAVKPDTILTPYSGYDQDHMAINRASRAVMRPHFFSGAVLEYAVGSETDFVPNAFMKLTEGELEAKVAAFGWYQTQRVADCHLLSECQIKVLAQRWGAFVNCQAAEGFIVRRAML